jgi:hypothetical protein
VNNGITITPGPLDKGRCGHQPMLNQVVALADTGQTETLLADNGFLSAANGRPSPSVALYSANTHGPRG